MSQLNSTSSYYINLCCKENKVHTIIEIQKSLYNHLDEISATKQELKRAPFAPAKGTYL